MSAVPSPTNLKRILLTLGAKGGTGKTLHCRQLYYFLTQAGVNCLAYDADHENPSFCEYHSKSQHPVCLLNIFDVSQAKVFFNHLESQSPEVVLLDMPGASGKLTRELIETFGFFNIAQEFGYRVTIETVINNGYDSISSLQAMIDYCGNAVDYVVVKSMMWQMEGMNFSRWDKSATRDAFLKLGGIEIEMPLLHLSAFDEMHEQALSFFEINQLALGDRLLVNSFLNRSLPQLHLARNYLGLPEQSQQMATATVPTTVPTTVKTTKTKSASGSNRTKKTEPKIETAGVTSESSN
jgi:hypothetical protein